MFRLVWPVDWLRRIAKFPHQNSTWLGGPAVVLSGPAPDAFIAPNNKFTGMLVVDAQQMPMKSEILHLYRLLPLYWEEVQFEKTHGLPALMRALDANHISTVVNLDRVNVAV